MAGKLVAAPVTAWQEALEREQARISRLLHDELGQALSAVGLQLDMLRADSSAAPEVCGRLTEILKVLEKLVERVRELSHDFDPNLVTRLGLAGALERLVERWQKSSPATLNWRHQGALHVPAKQAWAMYKIAEEALDNAMRHSAASLVEVSLRGRGLQVKLEVKDNGRGFPRASQQGAGANLGIGLMQGLARESGLRFELASQLEKGTIVTVVYCPHKRAAAARKQSR